MLGIKELARLHAKRNGITIAESEKIIKSVVATMTEAIAVSGGVSFIGQFSIQSIKRKEHIGRNPLTKEEYKVPAHIDIKVKCGKLLKERLNHHS